MKLIKELVTLVEDRVGGARLSVNAVSLSDAVELLHDNCSHAMSIFSHDTAIFRGDRMNDSAGKMCSIISTANSRRKSAGGIGNYYTEILDNIPSMKDFPKRSRSLICSTKFADAEQYGTEVYVIVPFDTAKVGIVGKHDIWEVYVELFGHHLPINHVNDFFKEMGIKDDWEDFEKFSDELKSGDEDAKSAFLNLPELKRVFSKEELEKEYERCKDDFIGVLNDVYSPEKTGMQWCYAADLKKHDLVQRTELWIEGDVVSLSYDAFIKAIEDLQ